jgi:hypothetical protein
MKGKKIGRKRSKDKKKAHINLYVTFVIIGNCVPENCRVYRKRIKQETH